MTATTQEVRFDGAGVFMGHVNAMASMIVCDSEEFSVDASWLSQGAAARRPLADELVSQEVQMIEGALEECGGRISGPSGAAAKLRMPSTTLDSRIKAVA